MTFEKYCQKVNISEVKKIDAVGLILFFLYKTGFEEASVSKINDHFEKANLPKYNPTYLKRDLSKSRVFIKGVAKNTYKLGLKSLNKYENELAIIFKKRKREIKVSERASLDETPLLSPTDISNAKKMAELYLVLHCYENSVRKYIHKILKREIGANWWDIVKNSSMTKKFTDRKSKEQRHKWISPRGNISPLYYLDWSDLLSIIRKQEQLFKNEISDLKFIELRFEELERIRNIVAHNGVIPSKDDFERTILSFKDWCKQVG